MTSKENKAAFLILAGLIATNMGICDACIDGVDTNCAQPVYSSSEDVLKDKFQVVPMYGVPTIEKPVVKDFPIMKKYGAPIKPKEDDKVDKKNGAKQQQGMMLRYAAPMRMDK